MIAKILLTGLLTFFLTGGIVVIKDGRDQHKDSAATEQRNFTKAIEYNGEIIPWIELPVVEITGSIDTGNLVHAVEIDGNFYPSIELDEVVITPGA